MLKMPIMYQQQQNAHDQPVGMVLQPQSNVPSSGQRSMNSLKNKVPKIKKGIKALPSSEISKKESGPNQNFMLIYEEQPNDTEEDAKPTSFQNQNASHDSLNKKVINVSFNDFNQSISNDCNDIE